jgi:hypothetical protein
MTIESSDEVQKAPGLLDEVHRLIEHRGRVFALSGSSARKVRRSSANLLGGRAVRYEMSGHDLNGLRQIRIDHPKLRWRFVVSLEPKPRVTEDGIVALP